MGWKQMVRRGAGKKGERASDRAIRGALIRGRDTTGRRRQGQRGVGVVFEQSEGPEHDNQSSDSSLRVIVSAADV